MNSINSSDDLRTDKFSKYIEEFEIPFTLNLERGDQLENVKVAYETYGELNQDKSNCILVCHAITGDSHAVSYTHLTLPTKA